MLHGGKSMEDIHNFIVNKPRDNIEYNLNEKGLHSRYMGTYYEPAIIRQIKNEKLFYWLFDGDIRDCNHPCYMSIKDGQISVVIYYSFERLTTFQPIIWYKDEKIIKLYNRYTNSRTKGLIKILNGYDNPDGERICCDELYFPHTPEFYPLCDQMEEDILRFKFAD